jgi:hypothetical protein
VELPVFPVMEAHDSKDGAPTMMKINKLIGAKKRPGCRPDDKSSG